MPWLVTGLRGRHPRVQCPFCYFKGLSLNGCVPLPLSAPSSQSLLLSPNLFWAPPCPSVPSSGLRPLPPPGQTESRLPVPSFTPALPRALSHGTGGWQRSLGGHRVSDDEKEPWNFKDLNQNKNRVTSLQMGILRPRVVKGFIQGCPVGQGSVGALQAGVPGPGDRAGGSEASTSHVIASWQL